MKKAILYAVLITAFLSLSSCQHNQDKNAVQNPSPYFANFITGNEDYVLRNIGFNLTPEELKKKETSKLYEEAPDHLFYEFSFPTDSTAFSEYANIQYFFNENNQLDIITADIYMNDSIQEIQLKNNLSDYFNIRYGLPDKGDTNQQIWKGTYEDKKANQSLNYTVDIKDLEDDYGVSIEYVRE